MNYKDFAKDIENDNLKSIYLCFGNESYLKDWIITELKKKYIDKSYESLNYVYLDGRDITVNSIVNACETLPFMSDYKVVVVEDLGLINTNKGVDSQEEAELLDYFDSVNPTTCLVFMQSDNKLDNRKKIIKKIKQIGAIIELDKVKDEDLNKWIIKNFKKNNKKINKGDLHFFVQFSGYLDGDSNKTLYDLENEINKISNFAGDKELITKEDVEMVLVKSLDNNIFKLVDGMGQRAADVALSNFNEMLIRNEPIPKIMFMIVRQFKLLIMSKLLNEMGYSTGDISKKLNVMNFIAQKMITQSHNFTRKELEDNLKSCLKIDEEIKKGKMDGKLALEMFIVENVKQN